MCGIVGVVSSEPIQERRWLLAGRDALRHRGPDGAGEWWAADARAWLGHRRLAIIDLTPAGAQPMLDRGGDLALTFNGEIYNYRELRADLAARGHTFVSDGDTAVILAAYREWGAGCVARLEGMFAFGLYDARAAQLLLARDRAGEKPLFYRLADGAIHFASELKALLADESLPRRADAVALDCYLADGYAPVERCLLQGFRKLPPAHTLKFEVVTGRAEVARYWRLPSPPAETERPDVSLLDDLERTLEQAVRRQLVADVPVGVLLSGGVDSSLVTAMAARANPAIKTFTVRFPGHASYDETEHARLVARAFGTDHVEIDAEAASVDLLPILARQFDEPMIDSSMVPTYLLSRVVRSHCTVALGGDGGDELFGGYPHYGRLLRMQRTTARVPRALRSAAGAASALLPTGFPGRSWARALGSDLARDVPPIAQIIDRDARARLYGSRLGTVGAAERIRAGRLPRDGDLVARATRLDFDTYLPEDLLVKVDRASMLTSLEVRAPLLDVRMIELAFGRVPSALKVTEAGRKILLKRLAARVLPATFDFARKQGFSIPLASWLRSGPWRESFREVLLDPGQTLFDRRFVDRLLASKATLRRNAEGLFGLVMFELWRREYRVEIA
jgi:asparagine synthase (glutamine-hydrolysing)